MYASEWRTHDQSSATCLDSLVDLGYVDAEFAQFRCKEDKI